MHHKPCSEIKGRLVEDPHFRCSRCRGTARPLDGRLATEFNMNEDVLEVVESFCYLGDMILASGGCERAITTRVRCAWSKFHELMPLLTARSVSLIRRGQLYNSCVRRVLLYSAECWATTAKDIDRLRRADRAMVRWICKVRLEDRVSSANLLKRLKLPPIEFTVQDSRLRWYGHVQRSDGWINKVTTLPIEGDMPRGRPKKT